LRKFVYVVQNIHTKVIHGIFPTKYQAESYIQHSPADHCIQKLRIAAKLSKKQMGIEED
jgi:hypothetical protein